ncbi:MAG: phenylalanine--tRNA ligase subunit beta, partial [Gammaproteobacteria bacterium]|nr:phenylalanine--tRNA ligase subunit beta [Gammaproteobacteria bacterium]
KLDTKINVRYAGTKEKLTLLDGQELQLTQQTLVIADQSKALAMAGVMGGEHSMVTDATSDIFLESAFFSPIEVANAARSYGLHTESSHRFERGVDFELQAKAIERATELILQIAGGTAGPTQEVTNKQYLPTIKPITLRKKRITHILGITIAADLITNILQNLQMQVEENQEGWEVRAPTHRFDITSEIDLIEEIARIYGYNNIPNRKPNSKLEIRPTSEKLLSERRIASLLLDKGYHEAITYSFVSLKLQELLQPEAKPLALQNPISQDMAVMRTSLWPGLIQAVLYNLNRQQSRIRLFETGLCFNKSQDELKQQPFLAGVITGNIYPQQWGVSTRTVDFFDLKGDIESLFSLTGMLPKIRFVKESHPALHPGKSTKIYHNNNVIGALGELHPGIKQKLDINTSIYLFELDFNYIRQGLLPQFNAVSKYPIMRRDIAIIVDEQIPSEQLIEEITSISNELLQDVQLFDIYQGEGVEKNKKSVALNLIFQHNSRTLIDTEIDDCVAEIVKQLQQQFNIVLRG